MVQGNIGVQAGEVYKQRRNVTFGMPTRTVIMVTRSRVYYTEGYDTGTLKIASLMEFEAVTDEFDYTRVGTVNVDDFDFEDNNAYSAMQSEEHVTSGHKVGE